MSRKHPHTMRSALFINVPPLSIQKDDITIAGEKEGVMTTKERILSICQEIVSSLWEPWEKNVRYVVLNSGVSLCGYKYRLS
jgi:hypothetical protein